MNYLDTCLGGIRDLVNVVCAYDLPYFFIHLDHYPYQPIPPQVQLDLFHLLQKGLRDIHTRASFCTSPSCVVYIQTSQYTSRGRRCYFVYFHETPEDKSQTHGFHRQSILQVWQNYLKTNIRPTFYTRSEKPQTSTTWLLGSCHQSFFYIGSL